MWFLMFLEKNNMRDMQKMGLQLTPEEIYNINKSSLKDAIVQFNGGCTAEIISRDGLVLTNHHCGYGQIAELSTPEADYLTNGFWAKTRAEELKPKSLYVRFFVRMDDVTKRILSKVNDGMSEEERDKAINQEVEIIQKENSENGKYTVSVRSFFQGNEFIILFIKITKTYAWLAHLQVVLVNLVAIQIIGNGHVIQAIFHCLEYMPIKTEIRLNILKTIYL
jgi:hypothetical protein